MSVNLIDSSTIRVVQNGDNISLASNANEYSTTETVIGTWIDGKPLYRKVYSITSPSSANANYADLSSLNIETTVHLYGYYKKPTGTFGIPFYDSDNNYSVIFINNSNQLRGRFGNSSEITNAKVVIEYTKTTD